MRKIIRMARGKSRGGLVIFALTSLVLNMSMAGVFFIGLSAQAVAEEPTPAENPTLASSCGIDMVLIIDSSESINADELALEKEALKDFVDAFLPNTPTQMAVVDFLRRQILFRIILVIKTYCIPRLIQYQKDIGQLTLTGKML